MKDDTTLYSLPRGSETILVAEDDETLRTLLGIALESCGYTVLKAAGGAEALRLAERHDGAIPLLISDVVMRGMDGCELADRLAALNPNLKVLLLSGYPVDPDLHGGVAFLQKPFRPSILVARVRTLLDAPPAHQALALIEHSRSPAASSPNGRRVAKLEACTYR
jgi:two-component system cell cycle sensor histidine kinase/response regulator CckA